MALRRIQDFVCMRFKKGPVRIVWQRYAPIHVTFDGTLSTDE